MAQKLWLALALVQMGFKKCLAVCLMAIISVGGCTAKTDTATAQHRRQFPSNFFWGVTIAGHQVEGGNDDSWTEWENLCKAKDCAKAGKAVDFWNRYESDVALAKSLGVTHVRFSFEWSRIEPTEGTYDTAAIAHYHAIVSSMRAAGIAPIVTLNHFANPHWLVSAANGVDQWLTGEAVDKFARYAGAMAKEFGADVDWWLTLNEPVGFVVAGYIAGLFPPGRLLDVAAAKEAVANQIRAHAAAYDAIKANDSIDADGDGKAALVSFAHATIWFEPNDPASQDDLTAVDDLDYLNNHMILVALTTGMLDLDFDKAYDGPGEGYHSELANRIDFIGLNYYTRNFADSFIKIDAKVMRGVPVVGTHTTLPHTDMGYEIYPQGLTKILLAMKRYDLPIFITENGIADAADTMRSRFIVEHLEAVLDAVDQGAPVIGYMQWTLMDNFEWSYGFDKRFGLYRIDYENDLARTPTSGVGATRDIIAAGYIDDVIREAWASKPYPPNQ